MKVSIERDGCIGCGLCADTCPEVFEMDAEGLAIVHTQPNAEQEGCAVEAAESCPVLVIQIEE